MADPLQLLREFTVSKKPIEATDTQIIFGELAADRKAETNYKARDGSFFSLEAVWFLLQRADEAHAKYIIECKNLGIPAVGVVDKKPLLSYLRDLKVVSDRIELTKYGGELVRVNRAATEDAQAPKRLKLDSELLEEKKKHAERLEASSTERASTLTDNIKPLSDKLSRERVAEIRALRAAQKRQSIQAPEEEAAASAAPPKTFLQADEIATREIIGRERLLRTRESVLQSKKKQFDNVIKVIVSVRKREEELKKQSSKKQPSYNRYEVREKDFWKERGAGTEEFQIDTGGGFLHRPNGNATPASAAQKPGAKSTPSGSHGAIPIILVPNAPTAVLTLFNAVDFLEHGKFVPTEEKKKEMKGKKPTRVTVHRIVNGKKIPFYVLDDASKFRLADWNRVVACFCTGAKWQFKGWSYNGDPSVIFTKMKGFYMMYADAQPDAAIANWAVQILQVNKTKRWLDATAHRTFWDNLDAFLGQRDTSHLALS